MISILNNSLWALAASVCVDCAGVYYLRLRLLVLDLAASVSTYISI